MNWILIGLVSGSLITSMFPTEEECEGRKAMILKKDKEISLKCHKINDLVGREDGNYIYWGN